MGFARSHDPGRWRRRRASRSALTEQATEQARELVREARQASRRATWKKARGCSMNRPDKRSPNLITAEDNPEKVESGHCPARQEAGVCGRREAGVDLTAANDKSASGQQSDSRVSKDNAVAMLCKGR